MTGGHETTYFQKSLYLRAVRRKKQDTLRNIRHHHTTKKTLCVSVCTVTLNRLFHSDTHPVQYAPKFRMDAFLL